MSYIKQLSMLMLFLMISLPIAYAENFDDYEDDLPTADAPEDLGQGCIDKAEASRGMAEYLDNSVVNKLLMVTLMLKGICTAASTVLSVMSVVDVFFGAPPFCCWISWAPSGVGACTGYHKAYTAVLNAYNQYLGFMCCVTNCNHCQGVNCFAKLQSKQDRLEQEAQTYDEEAQRLRDASKDISDGEMKNAYDKAADGYENDAKKKRTEAQGVDADPDKPTTEYGGGRNLELFVADASTLGLWRITSQKDGETWSILGGGARANSDVVGGETADSKLLDTLKSGALGSMDPYDNIYISGMCFCLPGVLINLQKLRAIYQSHQCCIEQACSNGISVEPCNQMLDESTCKYFKGSLVDSVIKMLAGIVKKFLQDYVINAILRNLLGSWSCAIAIIDARNLPEMVSSLGDNFDFEVGEPDCGDLGFDNIRDELNLKQAASERTDELRDLNAPVDFTMMDRDGDGIYDGLDMDDAGNEFVGKGGIAQIILDENSAAVKVVDGGNFKLEVVNSDGDKIEEDYEESTLSNYDTIYIPISGDRYRRYDTEEINGIYHDDFYGEYPVPYVEESTGKFKAYIGTDTVYTQDHSSNDNMGTHTIEQRGQPTITLNSPKTGGLSLTAMQRLGRAGYTDLTSNGGNLYVDEAQKISINKDTGNLVVNNKPINPQFYRRITGGVNNLIAADINFNAGSIRPLDDGKHAVVKDTAGQDYIVTLQTYRNPDFSGQTYLRHIEVEDGVAQTLQSHSSDEHLIDFIMENDGDVYEYEGKIWIEGNDKSGDLSTYNPKTQELSVNYGEKFDLFNYKTNTFKFSSDVGAITFERSQNKIKFPPYDLKLNDDKYWVGGADGDEIAIKDGKLYSYAEGQYLDIGELAVAGSGFTEEEVDTIIEKIEEYEEIIEELEEPEPEEEAETESEKNVEITSGANARLAAYEAQLVQRSARVLANLLVDEALGKWAKDASDGMCKQKVDSSEPEKETPQSTRSDASPYQDYTQYCMGERVTIATAQIVTKSKSPRLYSYDYNYGISACDGDVNYTLRLNTCFGGNCNAEIIRSGSVRNGERSLEIGNFNATGNYDEICVQTTKTQDMCVPYNGDTILIDHDIPTPSQPEQETVADGCYFDFEPFLRREANTYSWVYEINTCSPLIYSIMLAKDGEIYTREVLDQRNIGAENQIHTGEVTIDEDLNQICLINNSDIENKHCYTLLASAPSGTQFTINQKLKSPLAGQFYYDLKATVTPITRMDYAFYLRNSQTSFTKELNDGIVDEETELVWSGSAGDFDQVCLYSVIASDLGTNGQECINI